MARMATIDESLAELRQFMPWAHKPQTVEGQRQRIAGALNQYWRGEDFTLGIFGASSGRFLGGTGLHARSLNSRGLEVGYWIRTAFAGQGIATAVTQALIVYGFDYLRLTRLQCGHDTNNHASARVNDKCGFKIEGTLRKFETASTQEMKANGALASGDIVLRALCQEDLADLRWYEGATKRLTATDWLGAAVLP